MKKLLSIFALFIALNCFAGGDKVVKDTTIKGATVQIFEGSRGGRYIVVTSKNGNTYKKYFKK